MSEPAGKTALKPVYGWLPLVYFVIQVMSAYGLLSGFFIIISRRPATILNICIPPGWCMKEKFPILIFFSITIR